MKQTNVWLATPIRLQRRIRHRGKPSDPLMRQLMRQLLRRRFAQCSIEGAIMGYHCAKVMSDLQSGRPQHDVSVGKVYGSEMVQRLADFGLVVQGPRGQLGVGAAQAYGDGLCQYSWFVARAMTIAPGTSEVQRNIMAQRMLGLPRP